MPNPLALHTWTLDSTPLPEALAVAKRTGWEAVELRRIDFLRARAEAWGLRVSIAEPESVDMPAFAGTVTLRYARPQASATTAAPAP